jgi:hypothetical protein
MENINLQPIFKVGETVKLKSRASAVDGFNYPYGTIVRIYQEFPFSKYVNVVKAEGKYIPHDNDELTN